MSKRRKALSKPTRKAVFSKTNGKCAYCGCKLAYDKMQVDHMQPLAQGGANELDNLWPACRSCNHKKGSSSLESFRAQVEKFPKVLMSDSITYRNAVRFGLVIENSHQVEFYFEKMEEANG